MDIFEIATLIGSGVIVGIVLIAVFSENKETLAKLENWCIVFGSLSFAAAIVVVAFKIQIIPVKAAISLFFIGIPAYSVGLFLKVYSVASRKSKNK